MAVPVEHIWQRGALVQQSTAGAICTTAAQPLCAIDNDGVSGRPGQITVPWTYQDKDGNPAGTIFPNGFFEGGFNLNSAFGNGDLPCFTHFIAQTGTSGANGNSETLKDIAAGDVQSCGTLQLKKHWIGTAGTVDLNIGTTGTGAGAADVTTQHVVGADGQTSEVERKVGTYYVSEGLHGRGLVHHDARLLQRRQPQRHAGPGRAGGQHRRGPERLEHNLRSESARTSPARIRTRGSRS